MSSLMNEVYRSIYLIRLFFFFFQAEDGIRDLIVTGVQTCALPISCFNRYTFGEAVAEVIEFQSSEGEPVETSVDDWRRFAARASLYAAREKAHELGEIGRASCRERV